MQFNIPTLLTLFRVILIPFFVLAFYLPFSWAPFACALIFFVAAVTDWFDGFLARRWNQSTRFGAFLDPVADKVMVAIAMVLVAEHYHTWWVTLPAATMIAREIIISALREWMAELGKRSSVAVSWIGKVKTTAQTHCKEARVIVVVGGDGTMNEVVDGIVSCDMVTLGYIPVGTGSDLARGLRLSRRPVRGLRRIFKARRIRQIDYGVIAYGDDVLRHRRFIVSAGIGLDAEVRFRPLSYHL